MGSAQRLICIPLSLLLCVAITSVQVAAQGLFDATQNVNDIMDSPQFEPDNGVHMQQLFALYAVQFQKPYANSDDSDPIRSAAFAAFEQNVKAAIAHNASGASWTMGINQFTDGTPAATGGLFPGSWRKRVMAPRRRGARRFS
jgi:hypothetical protein